MNHTWKKNTCTRCLISRRGTGKQTLYSATLYDTSSFDEGEEVDCWVEQRPECSKPVVYEPSGSSGVTLGDFGATERLPGTFVEIEFASIPSLLAGKAVPISRVIAPDHVHAPRVPDDTPFSSEVAMVTEANKPFGAW